MADITIGNELSLSGDIAFGSGAGTTVRWGEITGNMENQADLVAALPTKTSDLTNDSGFVTDVIFTVTFTYNSATDTYTADKTAVEIYDAYTDGVVIEGKINNTVYHLSEIYRDEYDPGVYGYGFRFENVGVGGEVATIQYSYEPVGEEQGEPVYETTITFSGFNVPGPESLSYAVQFETESGSIISYEDWESVLEMRGAGQNIYAVLDGEKVFTAAFIPASYSSGDAAMIFTRNVGLTFETLYWEYNGSSASADLVTQTLSAWQGGSY